MGIYKAELSNNEIKNKLNNHLLEKEKESIYVKYSY